MISALTSSLQDDGRHQVDQVRDAVVSLFFVHVVELQAEPRERMPTGTDRDVLLLIADDLGVDREVVVPGADVESGRNPVAGRDIRAFGMYSVRNQPILLS